MEYTLHDTENQVYFYYVVLWIAGWKAFQRTGGHLSTYKVLSNENFNMTIGRNSGHLSPASLYAHTYLLSEPCFRERAMQIISISLHFLFVAILHLYAASLCPPY